MKHCRGEDKPDGESAQKRPHNGGLWAARFFGERLHVPLDAVARFNELLVTRRKARAAKTLTVFAKS